MDQTTIYEISGIPFLAHRPGPARLPKSIITTNWPTTFNPSSNQRILFSAWDASTLISPDSTQPHSQRSIYEVASILQELLIPDLTPQILRKADFLIRSSYEKKYEYAVPRSQSPYTYLVTPPIRSKVRLRHPVVKVVFTIVARDQGLDLGIGQSHFSAAKIQDQGLDLEGGTRSASPDDADSFARKYVQLAEEREVVRNTSASDYYETHVVEWSADSEDPGEAAWVAGLVNGDRIAVRVWAQWASFENRIRSVEVAIHTVAVVR